MMMTGCPHASRRWDVDEWVCVDCGRSVTYTAHAPTAHEEEERPLYIKGSSPQHGATTYTDETETTRDGRKRNKGMTPDVEYGALAAWAKERLAEPLERPLELIPGCISCVVCRRQQLPPAPDASGKVSCQGCGFPMLFTCDCCNENLAKSAFYTNATQVSREGVFRRCKRCLSAAKLAERLADPEPNRAKARAYSRGLQEQRVKGERPSVYSELSEEAKERMRESRRRSRARRNGQMVPLQRVGRTSLFGKQVCRAAIAGGCPLREFCTTEVKGVA